MADQPDGPGIGVAFSIQYPTPDLPMIGIHFDAPLSSYVVAFPIESAKALAANFGTELLATIAEAEKKKSPLVVASADTMNRLKGK